VVEKVEVPVLKNGQLTRTEKIIERYAEIADRLAGEVAQLKSQVAPAFQVSKPAPKPQQPAARPLHNMQRVMQRPANRPHSKVEGIRSKNEGGEGSVLLRGERGIIEALGRSYPMRLTKSQIGRLAKQSLKSSSFKEYFRHMLRDGLIYETPTGFALTDAGMAVRQDT
jgi:hypothetical protein